MAAQPAITASSEGAVLRLRVAGAWLVGDAEKLDRAIRNVAQVDGTIRRVEIDLSEVSRIDTAGVWLVHRTARDFKKSGIEVVYTGLDAEAHTLLEEIERNDRPLQPPRRRPPAWERIIVDTGQEVLEAGRDFVALVDLVGKVMATLGGHVVRPSRLRVTSVVYHLEHMALRAVPIVALITFLIGAIIEQQGAYQLRAFGAEIMSIDLAGILILREIGVLITAIMVAGRSGSAITAELGSMKMREEVDAMRTLALDPVEVLVVPRILALVIALPLLTFIANISALTGAALVAWVYIDVSPATFVDYLRTAVGMNTFLVGLIKAPFMALVIGMIACLEGLKVGGSAESLGRHTTSAVVKSIFMVIVLDGIFAMLFAAIDY
jgi:phospholipid/cholesterol/gamma-HCH transport system permease protein